MAERQSIRYGEMYHHNDHGQVEVTGIWRGVRKVDTAHQTNDSDRIIVNYALAGPGLQINELTDTLDEFLEKTK